MNKLQKSENKLHKFLNYFINKNNHVFINISRQHIDIFPI